MSDVTIDVRDGDITVYEIFADRWRVSLVDTGKATLTGGRLKRIRKYLEGDNDF
jgi:glucose-1-phosphate cytidylyltransferase